jgi:hypothetical protein
METAIIAAVVLWCAIWCAAILGCSPKLISASEDIEFIGIQTMPDTINKTTPRSEKWMK